MRSRLREALPFVHGFDVQPTEQTRTATESEPAVTASFAADASQDTTAPARSDTDRAPSREAGEVEPRQVGRFALRRRLGEGGFGAVFLAHDPVLGRDVAVKVRRTPGNSPGANAERFLAEARTAVRLQHPHVVTVYEVGECDRHGPYIAMEYVEGETLAQRLKRGKLSVLDAVRVCEQIADAMHHAHKLGIVHRDLKPGNVLLDSQGNAKVCDFGLAQPDDAPAARRGEVSGTWPYMSPEQIRGDVHLLDGRSDLWSLGVIFYECLCGRRPFRGDNLAEIHEDIQIRDPKPLRQFDDAIPAAADELFRRCTRRDMSQRLATALEFKHALAAIDCPPRRFRRAALAAAALAAIVLIGLASIVGWSRLGIHPAATPAANLFDRPPDVVDLLATTPRTFVFNPGDAQSHYAYMPATRHLNIDSNQWSLFSCGNQTGDAEFDVGVFPGGEGAIAGVFWGLRPVSVAAGAVEYECLSAVVSPNSDTDKNALVRRFLIRVVADGVGNLYVRSANDTGHAWIELDWTQPISLRVRVVEGAIADIQVQDAPTSLSPEAEATDYHPFASGEFGLIALGNNVTFVRCLRRNLKEPRE